MPPSAFLARLRPGVVIASYVAIDSEADPVLFDRAARAAGAIVALPFVMPGNPVMRFLRWDAERPLEPGPMRLMQPPIDAPEMVTDIVVTPLLAFDRALCRLGQGAGFYDRAFAACPAAWRIGLAWSVQEVAALTPDPWDVPLHMIATERGEIV